MKWFISNDIIYDSNWNAIFAWCTFFLLFLLCLMFMAFKLNCFDCYVVCKRKNDRMNKKKKKNSTMWNKNKNNWVQTKWSKVMAFQKDSKSTFNELRNKAPTNHQTGFIAIFVSNSLNIFFFCICSWHSIQNKKKSS